jgi:hypothetical protein
MKNFIRSVSVLALVSAVSCDTPAPSELDASIRSLLSGPLLVGDVVTFGGEAASLITADGGNEGAEYAFIVSNVSKAGGGTVQITVEGTGVSSGGPATVAERQPSMSISGRVQAQDAARPDGLQLLALDDEGFHRWHREREVRLVRDLAGNLSAGRRLSLLLESAQTAQEVPEVGDVLQVNVNAGDACANPDWQDARVEAVSEQAIVLADLRNPEGLTTADFERVASDFDSKVYPLSTATFGAPARQIGPDRTTILYTIAVNEFVSGFGGLVGGFFYARDLFPQVATPPFQACPASNEREMFYMLTADPDGAHGQAIETDFIRRRTLNTVMHEHQHLVNASRRLYIVGTGNLEAVWLNEGLSHVSEELLFYQESGLSPRSNLSLQDVTSSQQRLDAVNSYQVQNLVRYMLYLDDPPAQSPINPEDGLETRGAAWSFVRYLADNYVSDDTQFFMDLVNTSDVGIPNLENRLDRDLTAPLYRWDVSNFADDLVPGLSPFDRQPSWNFRSLLPALMEDESFPLSAQVLEPGQVRSLSIRGGSAGFIRFSVPAGERGTVGTLSGGSSPPATVRATLVRLR